MFRDSGLTFVAIILVSLRARDFHRLHGKNYIHFEDSEAFFSYIVD